MSNQQEINIAAGQYVITDFNLMQSANIPGTVTYNNQGIAGASIIATNINTGRVFTTSTNTSGNFTLTGLTGATYYIQVIKEGYSVNENFPTVQVGAGETSEPLEFTLTYTENSISGSAINAETMEGISAVSIELKQNNEVINSTNTNNSGSFIFANISDGEYTLSANHGAYESAGDMDVSVLDGISDPTQIDFLLTPKSKVIYGVVTNTKLNPLSNAIVYATIGDDSYQGITNANGQYSISVPAFGSYSVFATKQYFSNSSIVSIDLTENNPTAQLSFQLKQLPASLSGSITITDQTLEPYTIEQPISLLLVFIHLKQQSSKTITIQGTILLIISTY